MKRQRYPWENGVCYEPPPLPRMYGRSRAWLRPTFLTLALIAVITGAAIGMTITI